MKGKLAIGLALILALAAWLIFSSSKSPAPFTSEKNSSATRKPGRPRLPTPPVAFTTESADPKPEPPFTNLVGRMLDNQEKPRLSREQVDAYLAANRRSAGSLLAAFHATADADLLREAMEKFPRDPMVNFAALRNTNATPEEHRLWLESFKQTAPDNSLGSFLSALDYFKAGQNDKAVQELQIASGKNGLNDYTLEFTQNLEEAFRDAGYSPVEAKGFAMNQLMLPHLAELKQTSLDIVDLAKSYRQTGDESSAQAVLQFASNLGQQLQQQDAFHTLVSEFVGLAIERRALDLLNPGDPYSGASGTVQNRIDELNRYRNDLKGLIEKSLPLLQSLPDQELAVYLDRQKSFGAPSAMKWVIDKYGPVTQPPQLPPSR